MPDTANLDSNGGNAGSRKFGARQATRALLHGDVDEAVQYLRRRVHPEHAPIAVDLPVRVAGLAPDELLLFDRSEVQLFGRDGRLLYRGANAADAPRALSRAADDLSNTSASTQQTLNIPGGVFQRAQAQPVRLQMDYSLTLMRVVAQYKIAATDGELRTPEIGLCATLSDQDNISVRCKQIGQAPFCFSATLFGPDGRHNPEVVHCRPDYRPYLPSLIDALSFTGLDVRVRDPYGLIQYAVDPSALAQSYLLLKIYRERDHFRRTVIAQM